MLTRILVPLDGSSLAATALDFVQNMADTTCEITLLTTVLTHDYLVSATSPLVCLLPADKSFEEVCTDAQHYLDEIAHPLQQSGFHVHICIEAGDPAEWIVQIASERKVDLIAMSTHGRSGVNRLLFGSITSRVLKTAPCPVLVIPGRKPERQHEDKATELSFA